MNRSFFEVLRLGRRAAAVASLIATALLAAAAPAAADNVVVEWNAIAVGTALAVAQGPVPQTRSMALVAVAVNGAVDGPPGTFPPFRWPVGAAACAVADPGAIGRAHRTLSLLFPTQTAALDA